MRPILSQALRTMARTSASPLCGKAARTLASAMRCCGRSGPMPRARAAPKAAERSGPSARASANTARTTPIMAASAIRAPNRVTLDCCWNTPLPSWRPPSIGAGLFPRWGARVKSSAATGLGRDDDLAEHLAALEALEALLELAEREHRVDHGREAGRHLVERLADVAHRAAERAEDAVLLLEQLHQVHGRRYARGRAAGDEAAAPLHRQEAAVPGLGSDMLEDDVDALAFRQPAHLALEALVAVVDDVVGAERPCLLAFLVVADGGDHRAADRLGHLDGGGADARAAGMDEHRLAGLEPG